MKMRAFVWIGLICTVGAAAQAAQAAQTRAGAPPQPAPPLKVEVIAQGLRHPWGMAFLSAEKALVTERSGALRLLTRAGGRWSISEPLQGLPPVWAQGQGGLLDVTLDPQFASNRLVYWSYAEPRSDGAGTSVARGRLSADEQSLENVQVIFRQQPSSRGGLHFGSRLVFARDGTLFVALGERNDRDKAQDLATHFGKVVRINADGTVPKDNPFTGRSDARPEIWSYGHRNIQGAALHPRSGRLWTVEHGARGGDEINIPQAGRNYGWPVITYGRDYSFAKIGEGTAKPGMEQPVYYWDPSIAPAGAAFYDGELMPQFKGNLFVGALRGEQLVRLVLDGEKVVAEEPLLLRRNERYRCVVQGPDGALWLLTDASDGKVLRVSP
jgi:glucose/arabinose dehydrogenase